jgi:hypothetical protein
MQSFKNIFEENHYYLKKSCNFKISNAKSLCTYKTFISKLVSTQLNHNFISIEFRINRTLCLDCTLETNMVNQEEKKCRHNIQEHLNVEHKM